MSLTSALRNESHPVTIHLMTRYSNREALTALWHADLDEMAPVGEFLDAEVAAYLGYAFELCAVADLSDVPPLPGFFDALDSKIATGFLQLAGFVAAPGNDTDGMRDPMPAIARWLKAPVREVPASEEIDQFVGEAWVLVGLHDSYRRQVRELDQDTLRRHLTGLHDVLDAIRLGGRHLRPLWDAYLERGRPRLRSLGRVAASGPEFVPGWARGDLILGSTLIDIKTGWDVRDELDYCLNQLLGYALLDRADEYTLEDIGLYLARYAATITWPLHTLLPELIGQASADLDQLRRDFADVCQPSIDEDLAWLRAKRSAH